MQIQLFGISCFVAGVISCFSQPIHPSYCKTDSHSAIYEPFFLERSQKKKGSPRNLIPNSRCKSYTSPFYDLQYDCGAFVSVDFLYWYAQETNLEFSLKVKASSQKQGCFVLAPKKTSFITTHWAPGFRVGFGWNCGWDGFDVYVLWTSYHNETTCSKKSPFTGFENRVDLPAPGECALFNPWTNPAFFNQVPPFFDRLFGIWKLSLNQIDVEVGRKYWLSPSFNMRPFAAIRIAWIKDRFRTRSTKSFPSGSNPSNLIFLDQFKNQNWGVGFVGGIQPAWYFCDHLSLFANVDASLIWGGFKVKKRERYKDRDEREINYLHRTSDRFFQMSSILDLALGLRWEEPWCCYRYRTQVDIGWEHHIWFDQNYRIKTLASFTTTPLLTGFRSYVEERGNLCLGGFLSRLRFDF